MEPLTSAAYMRLSYLSDWLNSCILVGQCVTTLSREADKGSVEPVKRPLVVSLGP